VHVIKHLAVVFVKSNGNTYPKGRALMQVYRVEPPTISGGDMLTQTGNSVKI